MIVRPVFESSTAPEVIGNIRGPCAQFTIRQDGDDDFFLEVYPREGEQYRFYLTYSEDLVRGLNRDVIYEGGHLLFTDDSDSDSDSDSDDFRFVVAIKNTDYTVPTEEDVAECPVCYDTYEPMYGSNCGHHICLDCMQGMDKKGLVKCPLCRSDDFKFPIAVACNRKFIVV
jgi:hypothetical protein